MDKLSIKLTLLLTVLAPQFSWALELGVRPRFNTGFQFYEYSQDGFSFRSSNTGFASTTSGIEFSDFVPFVSGGLTVFADRFFVDAFVQYSFEGSDNGNFTNKNTIPAVAPLPSDSSTLTQNNFGVNFDRLEYSFSVGYAITDQFVAYAGYKKARTEFQASLNSKVNSVFTNNSLPNPFLSGTLTGNFNLDYEYDGAFIGGTYSQNIDLEFLKGALSANVAIAFMEGDVNVEYRDIRLRDNLGALQNVDDNTINAVLDPQDLKGDTVGVSVGLTWNGLTSVEGLGYVIGLSGYHYEFDGNKNSPNFSETVVRMDFGISYTF